MTPKGKFLAGWSIVSLLIVATLWNLPEAQRITVIMTWFVYLPSAYLGVELLRIVGAVVVAIFNPQKPRPQAQQRRRRMPTDVRPRARQGRTATAPGREVIG